MNNINKKERTFDFNKNWKFSLKNFKDAMEKNFDDTSWEKLNLPHDWSIEQDFTNDVSSEIGHLPGGIGWYRKSFILPKNLEGKRINIDFDGIYMDSYIYVNGKLVGNYPNGYIPFYFDITDYVIFDDEKENVIAIKVSNITNRGEQSSRWYSGSGIYRNVYLTITEPVHIAKYGTAIYTNNIENEYKSNKATADITATVQNDTHKDVFVKLRNTILCYKTKTPLTHPILSDEQKIHANNKLDIFQQIQIQNPKLWDTENPNLYLLKTEVLIDEKIMDTYETRFGFNWSKFDKDEGFSLNGKYMKLYGVCMHHDQGALGAVANKTAIKRQMKIMKDMGVNAIRVTHNPASPDLMQICDEMGLMVIEEAFDTWFYGKNKNDYGRFFEARCTYPNVSSDTTWAKFDLQNMIKMNRNCPSIIMWSLGNEIGETGVQKGFETLQNLIKWAKEIDTAHPVTMGEDKFRMNANATFEDWFVKVANELDVIGLNYAEDNYDYFRKIFKEKPLYGSETSSAVNSRGYYSDPWDSGKNAQDSAKYQLSSYDNRAVPWGKTASDSWTPDRDRKWICGQFIWTGFDYIGEPTPWNQSFTDAPKSSYFGIVDTAGFPKDDYFLYQSQWIDFSKNPMVHIFPHWNWEDDLIREKVTKDGNIPIRVYSNAPKVELFFNDISKGEKAFYKKQTIDGRKYQQKSENSNRLYLEWELPWEYKEGTTIKAIAKNEEGEIVAQDIIKTAGKAVKLKTEAETNIIKANGYDLAYITISAEDENGNFVPTAMNELNFRIVGDGKIVGVDNGDSASWERYKDTNGIWKRSLFNGKAIVIVSSTEKAGSFKLIAQGEGLKASFIKIYTKDNCQENKILGYETEDILTEVLKIPELPKTVFAICSNGDKKELKVAWENLDKSQFEKPAEFELKGIIENGEEIYINIIVSGACGFLPMATLTTIGNMPNLPKTAKLIYTDRAIKSKNIEKWEDISKEKLEKQGKFTIFGNIENSEEKVALNITVSESLENENKPILEEIKIDNKAIENFDVNKTQYFFSTEYNSNVPSISAKGSNIFICQPLTNDGVGVVYAVSEAGETFAYTIFFERKVPNLKFAKLNIKEYIKEDDILELDIQGTLEDGTIISSKYANVSYFVENKTGFASIKNGQLFAYEEGEIEIYAKVKYMDKEIITEKLALNIAKNNAEKFITSFEEIEIKTFAGQKPILPENILANFKNGLPREIKIQWEEIPNNLYENINTFFVFGNAKETEIKASAKIKVLDAIAVENFSSAIPEGYDIELPEKTTVYLSDGTEDTGKIDWESNFIQENDIIKYKGYVSYLKNKLPIYANFRISDFTDSPNYVIQRNGYDFPVGIASCSDFKNGYSAKKLNDGIISENAQNKQLWSNLGNNEDWVSVTIATEGLNAERIVNKVKFGFINEDGENGSIAFPGEYHIEYYTGDLNYPLNLLENENEKIAELGESHPLNKKENWKEVEYKNKSKIQDLKDFRLAMEVEFKPVKTHLIRIRAIAKKGYKMGIDELQIFGKIANVNNYFEVKSILLNGLNVLSKFSNNQLNINLQENEEMPEINVEATNNASVTIIPKTLQKPEINIKIVPENRSEVGIINYKIKFN